jgi:hypothetical protein
MHSTTCNVTPVYSLDAFRYFLKKLRVNLTPRNVAALAGKDLSKAGPRLREEPFDPTLLVYRRDGLLRRDPFRQVVGQSRLDSIHWEHH